MKQFPGRGDTGSSPCLSLVIQSWIGYFTIINAIFSLHCPEELEKGVHDRVLMWEFSHVLEESSNNWAIGARYFAMTVCTGCVTFKSPYGSDSSKFRLIFTVFNNGNVFPFELYPKCFFPLHVLEVRGKKCLGWDFFIFFFYLCYELLGGWRISY